MVFPFDRYEIGDVYTFFPCLDHCFKEIDKENNSVLSNFRSFNISNNLIKHFKYFLLFNFIQKTFSFQVSYNV